MGISVICPVKNEARFIRAWFRNVSRFADEILVCDTGSTDGTVEILESFRSPKLRLFSNPAQAYNWQEGKIRNELIEAASHEWIVNLDADELLGKEFLSALPALVESKHLFHRLVEYPFWYSPNFIRLRQWKNDWWRFYPKSQTRMFRNVPNIRYRETGNHSWLEWCGLGKHSSRLFSRTHKIPFYHYHFCLAKENENRAGERRMSGIKLQTFFGTHPPEAGYYDWFARLTY